MADDNDHSDHPAHASELSEMQLRVRALETVLAEKGYVDPAALDAMIEAYETRIGPHTGAAVVAKAWTDPAFKQALLADATEGGAIAWPDQPRRRPSHRRGEHANDPQHDRLYAVLLLPLGSARASPGLVQIRSVSFTSGKRPARRACRFRRFAAARRADSESGNSTAETRFIVLPMRPARHRRVERRKARSPGDARLHDRYRLAEISARTPA